jgi:hypothetical protein
MVVHPDRRGEVGALAIFAPTVSGSNLSAILYLLASIPVVSTLTHYRLRHISAKPMGQMKLRLLVFLAFEILCSACTQAQDVSDSTPVLRRGTNLVLVPTLIKTSSGEPVFGLTANDFILTDDGIEQKISLEENTDSQPLALVIVVQTGGAGGRRLDSYRRLGPLLDSMVGAVAHRVAVVGFDSEPRIEADFTPNLNNVRE